MPLNASNFITGRTNVISITDDRIRNILWYITECYQLLQRDKPQYSKKYVKSSTSFHFEDYLKVDFVDSYLIQNKLLLQNRLSELEEINFSYETEKRFTDSNGKQKKDKIDIFINKLGLKDEWKTQDEHIYFVLECKRIISLKGCNSYVSDIQKFCTRNYMHLRLPFEGMIGFIENKLLTHVEVSNEINSQLLNHATLKTASPLQSVSLNSGYEASYTSSHKKDFLPNDRFSIYHLFLEYANYIVN